MRVGLTALVAALAFTSIAGADQRSAALSTHFSQLQATSDETQIVALERAILGEWRLSGDPEVDRMLERATALVEQWAFDEALTLLDEVIARRPGFAEGWNQRATLHYIRNDFAASMVDIDRTLSLEPRHFGALAGLGEIHLKMGEPALALAAFERALEVHPHLPVVRFKVEQLREARAGGQF